MNGDLSGKAFKNVSGSSLQITDVGLFEIRPDGMVSTADYPILETSTQFRRFVTLSYLMEDPSLGRRVPDRSVQIQSLHTHISDEDLIRIADEVAKRISPQIQFAPQPTPPAQTPAAPPQKPAKRVLASDRGDTERAEIINHVIRTSLPAVEQFGDLDENPSETIPDVDEMVERIQNMGKPNGETPK